MGWADTVFFKVPGWFNVQAGLRIWQDPGGFAFLDAPGHLVSTLSSLAFHVPSCDLAQWGSSQLSEKQPDPERPHYKVTPSTSAPNILLCNVEGQDTHSWDAYTLWDLHAYLSPQLLLLLKFTFLKEVRGGGAQPPLNKPIFKRKLHAHTFLPWQADQPVNWYCPYPEWRANVRCWRVKIYKVNAENPSEGCHSMQTSVIQCHIVI